MKLVELILLLNKILAQQIIMRDRKKWATLGRNVFVINRVFKRRVLGLHLLDLDSILRRHTLGDKETSCASPMSGFIMGADICWRTGFGHLMRMIVDGV